HPMSLLRQRILDATVEQSPVPTEEPEVVAPAESVLRPLPAPEPPAARDRLPADVHEKVHRQIVRDLGPLLYDENVNEAELEAKLQHAIETTFAENGVGKEAHLYEQFARDVRNDVIGYGP